MNYINRLKGFFEGGDDNIPDSIERKHTKAVADLPEVALAELQEAHQELVIYIRQRMGEFRDRAGDEIPEADEEHYYQASLTERIAMLTIQVNALCGFFEDLRHMIEASIKEGDQGDD